MTNKTVRESTRLLNDRALEEINAECSSEEQFIDDVLRIAEKEAGDYLEVKRDEIDWQPSDEI